jgi:hypothetical protein
MFSNVNLLLLLFDFTFEKPKDESLCFILKIFVQKFKMFNIESVEGKCLELHGFTLQSIFWESNY